MKLFDILESRSQEQVHRNPSVNTLKSLARNNKYHSARFVITKDGDVVAADSEYYTHHSMAPYDGAWDVRGYVQYMDDGSYLYRSMQVYSALNKDHPILRIWERAGILNGNPDQSHLQEEQLQSIDQEDGDSGLEGYVVDTNQEQLRNYLSSQGTPHDLIDELQSRYTRIAIFKNIWVNEDQRGMGIGSSLMESAIQDAASKGAQAAILVAQADSDEDQLRLVQWYQSYGFSPVGKIFSGYPIMVLDLAQDQLEETWSKKYKKSINCSKPKGFSQRAHCAGRKKRQAGGTTNSRSVHENTPDVNYDNWIRYTPASLESDWREYVHKQDTKWRNRARVIGARWPMFDSKLEFQQALDQARIVNVDDLSDVENMTRNNSLADIKSMVGGYQNPRDVDRIVAGLHAGVPLPLPIILKGDSGMWIMAGNTRQATSRVLGITPQALLVDVTA